MLNIKSSIISFLILTCSLNAYADAIADSKKLGAESAGSFSDLAITKDANSLRNGLNSYKDITGIQGIEQLASPSSKSKTGLANVSTENGVNFSCGNVNSSSILSAGAVSFKINSCDKVGSEVTRVFLSFCDNGLYNGYCDANSYTSSISIDNGVFSATRSGSIGIGCEGLSCRLTSRVYTQIGGSDATLKSRAASAADSSQMAKNLNEIVANGSYGDKMKELAAPLVADQSNSGSSSCEDRRICSKQSTLTKSFKRSCSRTFPLTEQITKYSFEGLTASCNITMTKDKSGAIVETNSCVDSTTGLDARTGKSEIGETDKVCDSSDCSEYHITKYFVNTDVESSKIISQSASPSRVGGACDVTPESVLTSCPNNDWFGRTEDPINCKASMTDELGNAIPQATDIDYGNKKGCGFCLSPTVGKTCYAVNSPSNLESLGGADSTDSCAVLDNNPSCKLVSSSPTEGGTMGSLVISQTDTYECVESTTVCSEYTTANSCVTASTFGLEKEPAQASNYDAMSNALVAAAILDSTAQGAEGSQNVSSPKIFGGEDMRCTRATSGIGQLFGRNCCKISLERPIEGYLTREGCSLDHAKLAAARRSNYATYIGEYCSKKTRFPSKCLQRTQSYCAFQGILPRIIQEQGRVQLAQLAASGSNTSAVKGAVSFNFYDATDNGSWSSPINVNGSKISVWQWPAYCSDSAKADAMLVTSSNAKECPGAVSTYFASCSIGEACGELPAEPIEGSTSWEIVSIDPLERKTEAISRYVAVTGACNTSSYACSFEASAYPAGQGGRAVVSKNLSFPLFLNETNESGQTLSYQQYQINSVGDLMFKGYSVAGTLGNSLPASVRVDFSNNGGQSWQTLSLSTTAYKASQVSISGTGVVVSGGCDLETNGCSFDFTGTVTVTAKPFGSPKYPDCSGFTPGQLSVLDFGRMDLSEWLNTVMSKVKGETGAMVAGSTASAASQQVADFNNLYSAGKIQTSSPVGANIARAVPSEGFGPFNVKLVVGGYWPEYTGDPNEDTDIISKVVVDWGDCSTPEVLNRTESSSGVGFTSIHRFLAPNEYSCLGKPHKNVSHKINLTIYTKNSGIQSKNIYVENAWSEFPGGNDNNLNVNKTTIISK